jgi:hypothetical protein
VRSTMMDAVDVDDADTVVAAGRHTVHRDDDPASSPPPPPLPPAQCLSGLDLSPGLRRRRSPASSPFPPPSSPPPPSSSSAPVSGDDAGPATSPTGVGAHALVVRAAIGDGVSDASAAAARRDPDDQRRAASPGGETRADDYDYDYDDGGGGGGWDAWIDDPAADRHRPEGGAVVRLPRRGFWRTYDTVIMLSICSVVGIVIRMMSATWFRLKIGAVFSEDSALGTNLPLNVWSCFLLGLLCSGR